MKKSHPYVSALLMLSTLIILPSIVALPSTPLSPWSDNGGLPHALSAPPSSRSGNGYNISYADSVNSWQSRGTLKANNTFTNYEWRNSSFSQYPPSGYTTASQNLTIRDLTATSDIREIQGGTPAAPGDYFSCGTDNPSTRKYVALAMSFTPADKINVTVVRIYYGTFGSPQNIPLLVMVDNGTNPPVPGRVVLGAGVLTGTLGDDWHDIPVSTAGGHPITLNGGVRYWIVMNGTGINQPNRYYKWFYVQDPTDPSFDGKLACYYLVSPPGWKREQDYGMTWNFLTLVNVIPVDGNLKTRVYSSPDQVNMFLNSTQINTNTTRVGSNFHTFMLSANTSVTFTLNWTARFELSLMTGVASSYVAGLGSTLWNASFTSGTKPAMSYTWYNRTLKVSQIPQYWDVPDPASNVTNNGKLNFTASFSHGSGYLLVTQTDNVNIGNTWAATWLIRAKSNYTVVTSGPSQIVEWSQFNINITTPLSPSLCNITIYNSTGERVYTRIVSIPTASAFFYPVRFNESGNHVITFFDTHETLNEVSYVSLDGIDVILAQSSVQLDSPSMSATWGEVITIKVRYLNTTSGSQEFSSQPNFAVRTTEGTYDVSNITALGNGWFQFDFETRLLPSVGTYTVTIVATYGGFYTKEAAMTLELKQPTEGIPLIVVVFIGVGSASAVAAMVAARRYSSGRKVKEEKKSKVLLQTASLAQLVVVDLASGRSVYSRSIGTEESVDPNLVSGFLSANQSILGEVFRKKTSTGLRFADYGEYKVISNVGDHILSALFATEAAGEELTIVLEKFTQKFEKKYSKTLETWNGDPNAFKDADAIADEVFSLQLTSPYSLMEQDFSKRRLSGIEKKVVEEAGKISADRGFFFMPRIIDFLLTKEGVKRSETIDVIRSLVDKGILKQLTVSQAAELGNKGG